MPIAQTSAVAAAAAAAAASKTAPAFSRKKSVVSSLYRSLLRASKHFDNPTHGAVLSSLISRTGYDDDVDAYLAQLGNVSRASKGMDDEELSEEEKSKISKVHLSQEQARDLTRGYSELQRLRYERTKAARAAGSRNVFFDEDGVDATSPPSMEELFGGDLRQSRPPHAVLFRQLLKEYIGEGKNDDALMRFPSQINVNKGCEKDGVIANGGNSMLKIGDIIKREFRALPCQPTSGENQALGNPISSRFEDSARTEAAFLALRELNKKLAWAETLGFGLDVVDGGNDDNKAAHESKKKRNRRQAAQGVEQLPISKPSSYLRSGSYLVAHPLLSGYFNRAVIVILDHTEQGGEGTTKNGGTYGLVINKESRMAPSYLAGGSEKSNLKSAEEKETTRWRTLRDVIKVDSLPERLREAFGDSPVRDGGPVNPSVQMMHACSPEQEERLNIGGDVLPMILSDDIVEERTRVQQRDDKDDSIISSAMHTDEAVYYQGDIIRAAEAVIDGDMKQDDFSFVIGASCWEVGQLESEIARGYWLPCKGPPRMAFTGMCQYPEWVEDQGHGFKPRDDLWLSMMCAIGEEEGDLAHLFLKNEYDENGEACDEF